MRSFDRIACILSDVQNMGCEIILVSSGAIAIGANKLQAAGLAATQGIDTIITNGKTPAALYDTIKDGKDGTLFVGRCGQ